MNEARATETYGRSLMYVKAYFISAYLLVGCKSVNRDLLFSIGSWRNCALGRRQVSFECIPYHIYAPCWKPTAFRQQTTTFLNLCSPSRFTH